MWISCGVVSIPFQYSRICTRSVDRGLNLIPLIDRLATQSRVGLAMHHNEIGSDFHAMNAYYASSILVA